MWFAARWRIGPKIACYTGLMFGVRPFVSSRVLRGLLLPIIVGAIFISSACMGEVEMGELWEELAGAGNGEPFDPSSLDSLPDPARRFLLRAMAPGTRLATSVEFGMIGEIWLDPDGDPLALTAEQILTPPRGFIWQAAAGRGALRITGFDRYGRGAGEMRWSLWGLLPVMRARGEDVTRSAAGRLAMEAVLLPSSLVPGTGVRWEEVDDFSAAFHVAVDGEEVRTLLEVDADGRPVRVSAMRWSEAAGPGYDRFVVEMSGEMEADGYRIPVHLEAGWRLGDPDEFRFFQATLQRAAFR